MVKHDRCINYTNDAFGQKQKYKEIEEDVIGRKGVVEYLNNLGNQVIEERGIDSPEFEQFEIFEEEVRARLLKIQSLKELEVMRKAYNL